jgi:hypothetical protein
MSTEEYHIPTAKLILEVHYVFLKSGIKVVIDNSDPDFSGT